jgi:hypothetical protein
MTEQKKGIDSLLVQKTDTDPVQHIPAGIYVLSVLFIISSIIHMHVLFTQRSWYWELFKYLPAWLIPFRYFFSWIQRIIGLVIIVGLLRLKEIWRRIMIGLGIFTIGTIFLKHPYHGFKQHTRLLDERFGEYLILVGFTDYSFSDLTVWAIVVAYLLDIGFALLYIYYLSKPSIKIHFD